METYGPSFALLYNQKWGRFANTAAPKILKFYKTTTMAQTNKSVLDLCCGTGQLAVYFLQQGYRVTGIDLSKSMLEYAQINAQPYIESGGSVHHSLLSSQLTLQLT